MWGRPLAARVLAVYAAAVGGCGGSSQSPGPSESVRSVQVSGSTVGVGATSQFTATAVLASGTASDVTAFATWRSSDSSVLTVSNRGLASGLSEGTAEVSAVYQAVSGALRVTVTTCKLLFGIGGQNVIALGESVIWWAQGQNTCAPPKQGPVGATWESMAPAVARAVAGGAFGTSDHATITGMAPGTATIVATASGAVEARGSVTVLSTRESPPARVRIDGYAALPEKQTTALSAFAEWTDGKIKDVTSFSDWTSSNPAVATVSTTGFVTALSAGVSDIGVTYLGVTAIVRVTVIADDRDIVTAARANISAGSNGAGDFFYATVNAAYVLVSAATGRLAVELRDQHMKSLGHDYTEFVPKGSGVRAVSDSVDVPEDVTTICVTLWLRPDGGTPVSADLGCSPAHRQ